MHQARAHLPTFHREFALRCRQGDGACSLRLEQVARCTIVQAFQIKSPLSACCRCRKQLHSVALPTCASNVSRYFKLLQELLNYRRRWVRNCLLPTKKSEPHPRHVQRKIRKPATMLVRFVRRNGDPVAFAMPSAAADLTEGRCIRASTVPYMLQFHRWILPAHVRNGFAL